ncbi:hypothetical protein BKA93DRAFT_827081 [Sparassis latifolia]|uniref:MYND-type domain-containing protein n=1 Tax=Sparassis crispa TaxID=139825 RepID=A0A401GRR5_9APHY|nr:hypothetical protein SCP_0700990 [Sparassis crispa]GBE84918.1 hypothetical protein SCP_0700990 [Sparassis crispa]
MSTVPVTPGEENHEGSILPPFIRVVDPSIRAAHERSMPTREERKENLNNILVPCDADCGKVLPRNELKLCSRCKQARYCSQVCQKVDWRARHKAECGEGPPKDLTLKLAERALAVPKIVEYLWMMSILTLELITDTSNAARFVVNIQCDTKAADLASYVERMMSGARESAEKAQVVLHVSKSVRVPLAGAPARTQKAAADAREKYTKDHRDADGRYSRDNPVVTFFFSSEEDATGKDGAISVSYVIPAWALGYMASNPKETLRSAVFGDSEVDMSMTTLRDGLNNLMRNDKQNKLRLRGYPSGTKPSPQEQSEQRKPVVVVAEE